MKFDLSLTLFGVSMESILFSIWTAYRVYSGDVVTLPRGVEPTGAEDAKT
jgi:hypothetical protein